MEIEKLKEVLAANGLDEEQIDKIVTELKEKSSEEDDKSNKNDDDKVDANEGKVPADGNPADGEPPVPSDESASEDDLPPGTHDGNPNEEGVAPQEGDLPPVPPTDIPPEDVPPTDVPPADQTQEVSSDVPPVPPFDPTELLAKVDDYANKLSEAEATIEGLKTRIESLESALSSAGVLDKSEDTEELGIDDPRVPESGSVGAVDAFDDALSLLNGKRR